MSVCLFGYLSVRLSTLNLGNDKSNDKKNFVKPLAHGNSSVKSVPKALQD